MKIDLKDGINNNINKNNNVDNNNYNNNNNNNNHNNNNNNNINIVNNNVDQLKLELDKNFFRLQQLEVSCLNTNSNNAFEYVRKLYSDIKKVEVNTNNMNLANSKYFAYIKQTFESIINSVNELVIQIKNAFASNNDETLNIIDSKLAQNFTELKNFTDQSFNTIQQKFIEVGTAINNLNNKWIDMDNLIKNMQNKYNTCEIGYGLMSKTIDDLKLKIEEMKKGNSGQVIKDDNLDNKIVDYFKQYHVKVDEKITDNYNIMKKYMDDINNSLSNNMNNLCNKINDFIKNNERENKNEKNYEYNNEEDDIDDDNLIDESMKKNQNLEGEDEIDKDNKKINNYVMKVKEEDHAIKFMKIIDINKKISNDYKMIFKKMKHEDNVVIFEVIKNDSKEKLEDYIKELLKKINKKYKKKLARSGKDEDYYYILNVTDKQIQFHRKVNKKSDRFKNKFFFTKCEDRDKFLITYTNKWRGNKFNNKKNNGKKNKRNYNYNNYRKNNFNKKNSNNKSSNFVIAKLINQIGKLTGRMNQMSNNIGNNNGYGRFNRYKKRKNFKKKNSYNKGGFFQQGYGSRANPWFRNPFFF